MNAGTKRTRVAVVTTSRADFGIYRPVLESLSASPRIEPGLIATGMHLSPAFGLTISEVEASGFPVWAKPACMLPDEGVVAAAASAGKAVEVVGRALTEVRPDLVMVLGDRYEMLAVALAANIVALPIAHIHGGEETLGANDNAFRHAITKLSHFHFAATPAAGDRILQMGEQPSSVFVVGAPAIDVMSTTERVARGELLQSVGLQDAPFVLVALHPETLSRIPVERMIKSVWSAVMSSGMQILVTGANADVMGRTINDVWTERCAAEPRAAFIMSLGTKRFWSAMSHAAVMVGNSSSGIIEAASFHLPVVNIGDRQLGRERSGNVIDCGFEETEIRDAISRATGDAFRNSLANLVNVYGDGHAGARIRAALEQVRDPAALLQKKFHQYGDRTGSSPHGPGRMPLV